MKPSVRRAVRLSGTLCIAAAVSLCAVAAVPADVLPDPKAVLAALDLAPAPAPSATPKPRRRSFLGSGPIVLSGRGGVDVGMHRATTDTTALSSSQYGGTMTLSLQRRTDRSMVQIDQGVGYNAGTGSIGQMQLGYRTPDYAVEYGAIAGPAQTQLAIGGFTRGVRVSRPSLTGALELLGAATTGNGGVGYTAVGLRSTRMTPRGQLSVTALREVAQHGGGGSNSILAAAFQSYTMHGTSTFEAALNTPHGMDGILDGPHFAFAFTGTRNSGHGFLEFRAVDIPSGFASLNTINAPTLDLAMTMRRDLGRLSLGMSAEHQRIGQLGGPPDVSDRVTLDVSRGFGGSTLTLTGSDAIDRSLDNITTTRSVGVSLSHTLGRATALSETYQYSVENGTGGVALQRNVGVGISRQLGRGFLQLSVASGTSLDPSDLNVYREVTFGYTRPIGQRLDFTTTLGRLRQTNNGIASNSNTASLGLIRHLSSAMSLRVAATSNITTGLTTSRGTSIDMDLIGPIAFGGDASLRGSGDPRSPGVVRGHVFVAAGSDLSVAASQQRGYGNVLVVLDNTMTQRTDATGQYEFRFVKPGMHTIGIEAASLPAGFIADRLTDSLSVKGGQIANVDFGVGRFAGVGGRVLYGDGDAGVPGVNVIIDGLQKVTTDARGRWELGRLTPGTHRVAVSLQGLPSSVVFNGATEKVVQVVNGSVTPVDFVALKLGSVGGTVLVADPNDSSSFKGARDVYVTAQPGDYAAITDEAGQYLLDNLPPGTYQIQVDKETVPDGLSAGEPKTVTVAPGQHQDSVNLTLGEEEKSVVFTFKGGKRAPLVLTIDPSSAPPGAAVHVAVRGENLTGPVRLESDRFKPINLVRDSVSVSWVGTLIVPGTVQGDLSLEAVAPTGSASNVLIVDNKLPLIALRTIPAHPQPGRPLHLTIKTYAPVTAGDELVFEDGQHVKLRPPHGRTFEADIRLPAKPLPFNGEIVTRSGTRYSLQIK